MYVGEAGGESEKLVLYILLIVGGKYLPGGQEWPFQSISLILPGIGICRAHKPTVYVLLLSYYLLNSSYYPIYYHYLSFI